MRLHRPAARLVAIDLAANLSKPWDLEVSVCQWLPAHPWVGVGGGDAKEQTAAGRTMRTAGSNGLRYKKKSTTLHMRIERDDRR